MRTPILQAMRYFIQTPNSLTHVPPCTHTLALRISMDMDPRRRLAARCALPLINGLFAELQRPAILAAGFGVCFLCGLYPYLEMRRIR